MTPSMNKKNIISTMFLIFAISFSLFNFYHKKNIAKNGEYHASLYVVNKESVSKLRVVAHIEEDHFVTTTYLSSPALKGIAKFISKGKFIEYDGNGKYIYRYELTQVGNIDVLEANNAEVYLSMVGRAGLPKEEKINMLYHNDAVDIFDMMRDGNVVMYTKK